MRDKLILHATLCGLTHARLIADALDRQGPPDEGARPIRRALTDCAEPSGPKPKRWPKLHAWRP